MYFVYLLHFWFHLLFLSVLFFLFLVPHIKNTFHVNMFLLESSDQINRCNIKIPMKDTVEKGRVYLQMNPFSRSQMTSDLPKYNSINYSLTIID